MPKKVRSVRVPLELEDLDISAIVKECAKYLRDLESATLLKGQGNKEAAEALLGARQLDLGRRVGRRVWEARVRYGEKLRQSGKTSANPEVQALDEGS